MRAGLSRAAAAIEHWLETERAQLILWLPVALGAGISAWFVLPDAQHWTAWIAAGGALSLIGVALSGGRLGHVIAVAGIALALGCGLIWWRAERVAAPVLERPAMIRLEGRVERIEPLPARDLVRVTMAVAQPGVPPRIRVNLARKDLPPGLSRGAVIRLRARLMPPPEPSVPGAYDFARVAWFKGIGATGRGFAPVEIVTAGESPGADLRARLARHIQSRVAGSAGGIASALATGDRGAISDDDAEAMRRSGLAHLLSVSGLHVTAVTAAAMLLVLRLLALSPWLALSWRLPLVAAGAAALAAIGYTLLTGAEVPTIRSCIAALLVLLALGLGREALTLRLVAAGALFVLLLWPETVVGPSFQLSFAAVTAIIALHEHRRVRNWFARREEGQGRRLLRSLASLLLTGLVVELSLMPIALFHFHKAGIYGALANIVAIPMTTFVIMPLEALALMLDALGLGAPVWWLAEMALHALLGLAHLTASAPGAVAALPEMPGGAFGLIVIGGLWVALWRSPMRRLGLVPVAAGLIWTMAVPAPDLLVTGDGKHLAVRTPDGRLALLRDRAGDYVRTMLAENGGVDDELVALADQSGARCSADICLIRVAGRRIVATRSPYLLPWEEMTELCRSADVIVSDRRLPRGCVPRGLKLDREALAKSGGVAIRFRSGEVHSVRRGGHHPWIDPETVMPPRTPRKSASTAASKAAVDQ